MDTTDCDSLERRVERIEGFVLRQFNRLSSRIPASLTNEEMHVLSDMGRLFSTVAVSTEGNETETACVWCQNPYKETRRADFCDSCGGVRVGVLGGWSAPTPFDNPEAGRTTGVETAHKPIALPQLGRCRDCKNWSGSVDYQSHTYCAGWCQLPQNQTSGFIFSNNHGDQLSTSPDFGCVHHEPKELPRQMHATTLEEAIKYCGDAKAGEIITMNDDVAAQYRMWSIWPKATTYTVPGLRKEEGPDQYESEAAARSRLAALRSRQPIARGVGGHLEMQSLCGHFDAIFTKTFPVIRARASGGKIVQVDIMTPGDLANHVNPTIVIVDNAGSFGHGAVVYPVVNNHKLVGVEFKREQDRGTGYADGFITAIYTAVDAKGGA